MVQVQELLERQLPNVSMPLHTLAPGIRAPRRVDPNYASATARTRFDLLDFAAHLYPGDQSGLAMQAKAANGPPGTCCHIPATCSFASSRSFNRAIIQRSPARSNECPPELHEAGARRDFARCDHAAFLTGRLPWLFKDRKLGKMTSRATPHPPARARPLKLAQHVAHGSSHGSLQRAGQVVFAGLAQLCAVTGDLRRAQLFEEAHFNDARRAKSSPPLRARSTSDPTAVCDLPFLGTTRQGWSWLSWRARGLEDALTGGTEFGRRLGRRSLRKVPFSILHLQIMRRPPLPGHGSIAKLLRNKCFQKGDQARIAQGCAVRGRGDDAKVPPPLASRWIAAVFGHRRRRNPPLPVRKVPFSILHLQIMRRPLVPAQAKLKAKLKRKATRLLRKGPLDQAGGVGGVPLFARSPLTSACHVNVPPALASRQVSRRVIHAVLCRLLKRRLPHRGCTLPFSALHLGRLPMPTQVKFSKLHRAGTHPNVQQGDQAGTQTRIAQTCAFRGVVGRVRLFSEGLFSLAGCLQVPPALASRRINRVVHLVLGRLIRRRLPLRAQVLRLSVCHRTRSAGIIHLDPLETRGSSASRRPTFDRDLHRWERGVQSPQWSSLAKGRALGEFVRGCDSCRWHLNFVPRPDETDSISGSRQGWGHVHRHVFPCYQLTLEETLLVRCILPAHHVVHTRSKLPASGLPEMRCSRQFHPAGSILPRTGAHKGSAQTCAVRGVVGRVRLFLEAPFNVAGRVNTLPALASRRISRVVHIVLDRLIRRRLPLRAQVLRLSVCHRTRSVGIIHLDPLETRGSSASRRPTFDYMKDLLAAPSAAQDGRTTLPPSARCSCHSAVQTKSFFAGFCKAHRCTPHIVTTNVLFSTFRLEIVQASMQPRRKE
ncbi:unnamed protein product [Symbiodinium natans]|uniref:Uncharacterized protein n=1 Tax=Symbiodinium natans TaxID=878477 RepID=A0A812SYT9_9DINO|nr:unnamed protein product [Symbiodinium natans]